MTRVSSVRCLGCLSPEKKRAWCHFCAVCDSRVVLLLPDRLRCVVRADSLMLDRGSCSMMQHCNATGYMARENVIFTLCRCRGCPGVC